MNEQQMVDCREVFSYFDSKGDDKISVKQIGDVLRALGQNPTQLQIQKYSSNWKEFETRITFEEFLPIFCSISRDITNYAPEELVEGLSHLDRDGNGSISTAELKHLLTTLGEKLTNDEVDQLVNGHEDTNGNISILAFTRSMYSKS